jgi:hypothetical protein
MSARDTTYGDVDVAPRAIPTGLRAGGNANAG